MTRLPRSAFETSLLMNSSRVSVTEGEGENAKTYPLVKKLDENGAHVKAMHSTFDWNIKSINDIVNLACDLLAPFDLLFRVILSGEQIIVLEDPSEERADIRINGGMGYNYSIIPLQ